MLLNRLANGRNIYINNITQFALREIGTRVLEDMDLIGKGLPPVACRRAERETVAMMRSKPVDRA